MSCQWKVKHKVDKGHISKLYAKTMTTLMFGGLAFRRSSYDVNLTLLNFFDEEMS